MTDKFILEGHTAVPCDDLLAWAKWLQDADTCVAKTEMADIRVSTVFLGLNHRFDEGPPLIFETMIFGGDHDETMWRYSTWEEAEAGHERVVALAKEANP